MDHLVLTRMRAAAGAALLVSSFALPGHADEGAAEEEAGDPPAKESVETEAAPKPAAAVSDPGKQLLIGARYRGIIVPTFYTSLFADGGGTFYFHAVGPEFAIRDDHFEFNLSPWFAFYSVPPTPYKGKDDPNTAWEIIEANITMLYLSSDFLWDREVASKLSVIYGFGAGLGLVFGPLERVQAFPVPGSDPNDPDSYLPCVAPGVPDANFCNGADNNRFPGNDDRFEPSFFNGGSKPPFFPWITAQTGLRYVAHEDFVVRLDVGIGTGGIFFGVGGDYAL